MKKSVQKGDYYRINQGISDKIAKFFGNFETSINSTSLCLFKYSEASSLGSGNEEDILIIMFTRIQNKLMK